MGGDKYYMVTFSHFKIIPLGVTMIVSIAYMIVTKGIYLCNLFCVKMYEVIILLVGDLG